MTDMCHKSRRNRILCEYATETSAQSGSSLPVIHHKDTAGLKVIVKVSDTTGGPSHDKAAIIPPVMIKGIIQNNPSHPLLP